MKNIDIKSIIIGALLTSTIFLGVAATSPTDKWDDKQEWVVAPSRALAHLGVAEWVTIGKDDGGDVKGHKTSGGWEPFGIDPDTNLYLYRQRIK